MIFYYDLPEGCQSSDEYPPISAVCALNNVGLIFKY